MLALWRDHHLRRTGDTAAASAAVLLGAFRALSAVLCVAAIALSAAAVAFRVVVLGAHILREHHMGLSALAEVGFVVSKHDFHLGGLNVRHPSLW